MNFYFFGFVRAYVYVPESPWRKSNCLFGVSGDIFPNAAFILRSKRFVTAFSAEYSDLFTLGYPRKNDRRKHFLAKIVKYSALLGGNRQHGIFPLIGERKNLRIIALAGVFGNTPGFYRSAFSVSCRPALVRNKIFAVNIGACKASVVHNAHLNRMFSGGKMHIGVFRVNYPVKLDISRSVKFYFKGTVSRRVKSFDKFN